MSDKANLSPDDTGSIAGMAGVVVVNTAHEGYRRAGLVLHSGENTLPPLSVSVLEALEADPRLVVTVIPADTDRDAPGRLDNPSASAAVAEGAEGEQPEVTLTADAPNVPAAAGQVAEDAEKPAVKGRGKK
ncbi:TPA: HI1506-related protein [Morganella morganii]